MIFTYSTAFIAAENVYLNNHDSIQPEGIELVMKTQNDSLVYNYQSADSLTYNYYLAGKWDQLIATAKAAISQNIDFKKLRQRMGYAYYYKANYFEAQKQFEAALTFDSSDNEIITYLYYCGLYTGNESYARYQLSKLPKETREALGVHSVKLIDAVDLEYNYKINNSGTRTNPTYMRLGINTQLGYRLNLYQAGSTYSQTVNTNVLTSQNEYFALLSWKFIAHGSLDFGYHYVNTKVETSIFNGHLFLAGLNIDLQKLELGISGSLLSNLMGKYYQTGIKARYVFQGNAGLYLKTSAQLLSDSINSGLVFSQSAGVTLFKKLTLEGNITLGNLKNFVDNNGLYVYNSLDATTFRTGVTVFFPIFTKITSFFNYTYDIKHISDNNTNYNQHSFSGGLIWKI